MAFERRGQRFNFDEADLDLQDGETPEEGWTRRLKIYTIVDYQRYFNARMSPIPEPGQKGPTAAALKHVAKRTYEAARKNQGKESL